MVILHIYGARAIFPLFDDDQDTLSTWCEIEMNTLQIIFTHKMYPRIYGEMISILYKMEEKYCGNSSYLWG